VGRLAHANALRRGRQGDEAEGEQEREAARDGNRARRPPASAGEWLIEWLEDGVLAGAALNGYSRLPQLGLYEICEAVTNGSN